MYDALLLLPPTKAEITEYIWKQFFQRLHSLVAVRTVFQLNTDPTTNDLKENTWAVYKNTISGDVKLWANDAGVLKSITLT